MTAKPTIWFLDVLQEIYIIYKLDGVGPVENGPSTDKLHHIVNKKIKNKI